MALILSFDDDPSLYTFNFINYLSLKSTFCIIDSRAISRPDILQDTYQLSIHTESDPLTTLDEQIIAELGWPSKISPTRRQIR